MIAHAICYGLALIAAAVLLYLWLPVAYQAIRGGEEDLRHGDDWMSEGGVGRG